MENQNQTEDLRITLEKFLTRLSANPKTDELKKTPDNKAYYLPIDFVETGLDELFYGLWETVNFDYKQIQNEITGSIELRVFHPIAQTWITRTGTASLQIMVDKAPENLSGQDKNRWALDVQNKKPNALDMGIPKLKSDCIKNAALSLGNIFGRCLNRSAKDTYKPLFTMWSQKQLTQNENATATA